MSRSTRFGLLGAALVVVVVAVVIAASGGGGDNKSKAKAKTPQVTRITVKKGAPVGGVHKVSVTQGDRVRLVVSSPDTKSEVHVHGYNVLKDMKPRHPVTFSFPARLEGVFEVELEETSRQIAKLTVAPK